MLQRAWLLRMTITAALLLTAAFGGGWKLDRALFF
jgi:hypothetical protein